MMATYSELSPEEKVKVKKLFVKMATYSKLSPKEQMEKVKAEKLFVKKLGGTKIVYSPPEEGRDCMVVRNFNRDIKYGCFVVRGRVDMEYTFHSILALLDKNQDKLKAECGGCSIWLSDVLSCIKEDDRMKMVRTSDQQNKLVEVRLTKGNLIWLMNIQPDDQNGTVSTEVYLFISDALKLVQHMENKLNIGDSTITENSVCTEIIGKNENTKQANKWVQYAFSGSLKIVNLLIRISNEI